MDRRSFLLGASAVALPIPNNNAMHFKVFRNGNAVGEHTVSFSQSGGLLSVTVNASLLVTMAMIPVFRYGVKATEIWQDGVFQSLQSAVNFNGTPLTVQAERTRNGYSVQGTKVPLYQAPADLLPLTYWNKAMLNGTILNIQTAHSYPAQVASPGWNNLPTANGGVLQAQRFDLSGKLHLSVWYDRNNNWSGLEFQKNGDISYEKYV